MCEVFSQISDPIIKNGAKLNNKRQGCVKVEACLRYIADPSDHFRLLSSSSGLTPFGIGRTNQDGGRSTFITQALQSSAQALRTHQSTQDLNGFMRYF